MGAFGRNHLRVLRQLPNAELTAIVDTDPNRAGAAGTEVGIPVLTLSELPGKIDAAVVAVPTSNHAEVGCALLDAGIDVLIEKPIAGDLPSARRLVESAERNSRILQVGHLERYNPAVAALTKIVHHPLFFEIHRLSVFSPRSLDVDVVLDLMIHDLDILLALTNSQPSEIRAAGIPILSEKADIANVRLEFPDGCIANLTASRVSTERVRKLRLFQPHQYVSLDYQRQDAVAFTVSDDRRIGFEQLPVTKDEPLKLELEAFLDCAATRKPPQCSGADGLRALDLALAILAKIEEHTKLIARQLQPRT